MLTARNCAHAKWTVCGDLPVGLRFEQRPGVSISTKTKKMEIDLREVVDGSGPCGRSCAPDGVRLSPPPEGAIALFVQHAARCATSNGKKKHICTASAPPSAFYLRGPNADWFAVLLGILHSHTTARVERAARTSVVRALLSPLLRDPALLSRAVHATAARRPVSRARPQSQQARRRDADRDPRAPHVRARRAGAAGYNGEQGRSDPRCRCSRRGSRAGSCSVAVVLAGAAAGLGSALPPPAFR